MVYEPSKRIQFLGAVAIIALGGIVGYKLLGNRIFAKSQQASLEVVSSDLSSQSGVDSDGDGLKDWQEALWGTDPHNTDSDGDGTQDGEEVTEGRDPLVAGPNDEISVTRPWLSASSTAYASSTFDSSDPYDANGNSSDKLARELFIQFMANGGSDSEDLASDTQAEIVNKTISDIQAPKITPAFTLSDLHITDSNSKETIQAYADALSAASQNALQSYADADPDTTPFSELINAFNDEANALIAIPVPGDLAITQLNLANNFNAMYQEYEILNEYNQSDPVKALTAVQTIQSIEAAQKDLYTQIATYFQNNGILFDENGPGFSLINAQARKLFVNYFLQ